MSKNTGGPAFPMADPFAFSPANEGYAKRLAEGMSMRDYFAAKALHGILASFASYDARELMVQNAIEEKRSAKEQVAFAAYEYADAMLAERAK